MKKKKWTSEESFEAIQNSKWARITETLYGIIMLNVMFILFSFSGLLIFGIGPATLAIYEWLKVNEGLYVEPSMIKSIWKYFKKYFLIGNGLMYMLVVIGFIFIHNISYYFSTTSYLAQIGLLVICGLFILFTFITINIFWVYVNFESLQFADKVRTSFYIIFKKPFLFIRLTVILLGFLFLMLLFPQFSIFFGFATPIYIINKELTISLASLFATDDQHQEEE